MAVSQYWATTCPPSLGVVFEAGMSEDTPTGVLEAGLHDGMMGHMLE